MKIYNVEHTGVDFRGYAIILANNKKEARKLFFNDHVKEYYPYLKIISITEINTNTAQILMIDYGSYS